MGIVDPTPNWYVGVNQGWRWLERVCGPIGVVGAGCGEGLWVVGLPVPSPKGVGGPIRGQQLGGRAVDG